MAIPYEAIPLQQTFFDPMKVYLQMKQMRALRDEQKVRDLQTQREQMAIDEAQRQLKERQAVRDAYAAGVTPGQQTSYENHPLSLDGPTQADLSSIGGGSVPVASAPTTMPGATKGVSTPASFDRAKVLQAIAQNAPAMYPEIQGQFAAQDAAAQKAELDMREKQAQIRKTLSEADNKTFDTIKGITDFSDKQLSTMYAIPPEQRALAYPAIRQQAIQTFPQMASQLPEQYPGDQWLMGHIADTQLVKDELERKQKEAQFNETVRHNKATESQAAANAAADSSGESLTPEAIDQAAKLYLQTAQLPSMGMGKQGAKQRQLIMNRAAEIGAGIDLAHSKLEFGAKKSTQTYFTSGAGGKQLTAFNTAVQHLDTLDRLAGDLNNTDIQILNRAKQAWATQTGNPAPANFDAAKNAMSGEVAAALKASGATDQEIAKVGETFSRAQSPAQLKGAIGTYRELLKSKAQQLKRQYDAGMKGGAAFDTPQTTADPLGIL